MMESMEKHQHKLFPALMNDMFALSIHIMYVIFNHLLQTEYRYMGNGKVKEMYCALLCCLIYFGKYRKGRKQNRKTSAGHNTCKQGQKLVSYHK